MPGYTIPTALPFDRLAGAGNPYQATTPEQLGTLYAGAQGAATALNQTNYGNIVSGYQSILDSQNAAQQQAHAGYGALGDRVLGDLSMAGTTQRQQIADQYAREGGDIQQQMLNSGLRGSTVQAGLQRGLLYDRQKAENDVMERVGSLKAGYRTQIGTAGLGFDERSIGANTALGQNQLGFMERLNMPYPQAGAYDAVATRMGAAAQQDKDREAMQRAAAAANAAANKAGGGTPAMPGGYAPPPHFNSGGSGYSGQPLSGGVPPDRPLPRSPVMTSPSRAGFTGNAGVLAGDGRPASGYDSGFTSPYGTPTGEGFAGGFGRQTGAASGDGYDLAGEDQPYGQAPTAGYGAWQPYGAGGGGFGNTYVTPAQAGPANYEYGAGGGDLSNGTQSTIDFYFGE